MKAAPAQVHSWDMAVSPHDLLMVQCGMECMNDMMLIKNNFNWQNFRSFVHLLISD